MNNGRGGNSNYVVHSYGGRGDGFMAGYMMGMIPWYWHTPFHPAFYYSQPVIVNGANGTREVYPGTFSIGSLLLILLCLVSLIAETPLLVIIKLLQNLNMVLMVIPILFLLLLWLLNTGSAASVSSLLYLVPPATAFEAFLLFGEKVNTQGILGIGITALGVWLVIAN